MSHPNHARSRASRSGASRNGSTGDTLGGAYVPPHSDDAECSVLGAMMLEREAAQAVLAIIRHGDVFYREDHTLIFEAMKALADRNQPIDIVTLNAELRRSGVLDAIGGSHYLSELNLRTPTAANVEHHARIVAEKALRRGGIRRCMEHMAAFYDDAADVFETIDAFDRSATALSERRSRTGARKFSDVVVRTVEDIERRHTARQEGRLLGVPTGLTRLDAMLGGYQAPNLYIDAARPSMGKTAKLMGAVEAAAKAGHNPLVLSLEMSDEQLVMRSIAGECGIDLHRLVTGNLDNQHFQQIVAKIHRLAELSVWIEDNSGMTIADIRSLARYHKRKHGIGIMFVDYIGLVDFSDTNAERRDLQIGSVTRTLKNLAKELSIPVVALSQLSRKVEERHDKRPMLSDLRESGSVEQDSDVVTFIYRPEYYGVTVDDDGMPTEGMAEMIVAKQRQGPTGSIKCAFVKEQARFADLAFRDDEPQQPF